MKISVIVSVVSVLMAVAALGYAALVSSDVIDESDARSCAQAKFDTFAPQLRQKGYDVMDFSGPTRIVASSAPYAYNWTSSVRNEKRMTIDVLVEWGCSTELFFREEGV